MAKFCGHRTNCDCPTEPGLHRVGPEPWAFVYNPAEGERVAVQLLDGDLVEGTISAVDHNEETNEIGLTVEWSEESLGERIEG